MNSFKKFIAIVLSSVLVFLFAACGQKEKPKEQDKTQKTEYIENWVIEPSIIADKIYSLPLCSFNEETNHYDVTFGDAYTFEKNGKLGFIDSNGNVVIEPKYDTITTCPCTKGYIATIKPENSYRTTYTIDLSFQEMWSYPHKCDGSSAYTYIWNSSSQSVSVQNSETQVSGGALLPEAVETDGGNYAIAANGKIQSQEEYSNAGIFTGGVVAVEKDGKWGYVNWTGEKIIPFSYDAIEGYSATGKEDTPYECSEGYITVLKDGKYGVFSSDGKEVIPCRYKHMTTVHDGRVFVSNDGNVWGVLLVDKSISQGIKYEQKTIISTTTSTAQTTENLSTDNTASYF